MFHCFLFWFLATSFFFSRTVPARWQLELSTVLLGEYSYGAVSMSCLQSHPGLTHFLTGVILFYKTIWLFIKSYLDKNSLTKCERFLYGLQINRHELSKLRKVFKEYCHNTLRNVKFQSIVEIDKTLFGRQVKFHKGYPNRWLKIKFLKSICLTCTYFSFIYLLIMTLKSN